MTRYVSLVWGIKSSWVDYVARMKDGHVELSDGAVRLASGEFSFPHAARGDALDFRGGVHFTGHYGMLAVSFVNPSIEQGDDGLYVAVDGDDFARLRVVRFDVATSEGEESALESPRLTPAGADIFFDKYRPATVFDPVRLIGDGAVSTRKRSAAL